MSSLPADPYRVLTDNPLHSPLSLGANASDENPDGKLPAVSIRELKKSYVLKSETVHALRGVSFDVPEGDYVAIMGPSGSGKSTLAHVIAGRDDYEVTQGEILYNGKDLLEMEIEPPETG